MMKTGIVTYQYADNYGAVLQCLALQRVLQESGCDASVINYYDPVLRKSFWKGWGIRRRIFLQKLKDKWLIIKYAIPARKMRRNFERFRRAHLKLSDPCRTNEEIADVVKDYDALVAGSDQIWNYALRPMFFLDWGCPFRGKRISYAPCCGRPDQDLTGRPDVKDWLSRFDHISVRNGFSKEIIERFTDKEIAVVCDPTVLTDLSDVQLKVDLPCKDYILMYTLGKEIPGGHAPVIARIREQVGNLPVVAVIPSAHQPHLAPWANIKIMDAGPAEWLWLIANSKFVYTDSFHGALFSMKYKKPFLAYYTEKGRAPRLLDLAQRYTVESAVAGSAEEAFEQDFLQPLDYQKIEGLMLQEAEFSMAYLKNALGN